MVVRPDENAELAVARAKGIALLGVIGTGGLGGLLGTAVTPLVAHHLSATRREHCSPWKPHSWCCTLPCTVPSKNGCSRPAAPCSCTPACPAPSCTADCAPAAGTFGRVYRAQYRGRTVAIKILDFADADKRVRADNVANSFPVLPALCSNWAVS